MMTNFYGKQCDVGGGGGYPNCSQGYGKLRQVPVHQSGDVTICDKDAHQQCTGAAVPRLPGPLRAREEATRQQPAASGPTRATLTDLAMATADYNKWRFFDVYLDLTERGLGMSIRGGSDSPDKHGNIDVYVSRILGGGAVAMDGRLELGDILLEVNGVSLENITHKSAVDNILKASPYIHFYVKRPTVASDTSDIYEQIAEEAEDAPLIGEGGGSGGGQTDRLTQFDGAFNSDAENCIKVELIRDENGFGFSLTGGIDNQMAPNDTRIYVSKLVQNGPAHRNGLIQVGDQIVAVNNTNLERVPYRWALQLIRNSPALSVFTIRKAVVWD